MSPLQIPIKRPVKSWRPSFTRTFQVLVLGIQKSDAHRNVKFIPCDVTSWEDQQSAFKSAIRNSPNKSVDVVVANAGISGPDDLFNIEGEIVQGLAQVGIANETSPSRHRGRSEARAENT